MTEKNEKALAELRELAAKIRRGDLHRGGSVVAPLAQCPDVCVFVPEGDTVRTGASRASSWAWMELAGAEETGRERETG